MHYEDIRKLHTDHNQIKENDIIHDVHTQLVTSELVWGVGEHELAQSQRADLFHLADGARSLRRSVVAEAPKQLAHDVLFGVQPRAYDKREAEALLVLGVETAHA